MTRAISRYPGSVPVASFINYDDAVAGRKTEFMVVGKQIDSNVSVTFWNGNSEISASLGSVDGPDANDEFMLQAHITFPDSGIYQLILQNPNVPKHVEPCWVYVEG